MQEKPKEEVCWSPQLLAERKDQVTTSIQEPELMPVCCLT